VIKGGEIDKRLNRRSRLPFGLSRSIELADLETEAAADRQYASAMRIHGNERARYLGDLAQGIGNRCLGIDCLALRV
jgi:hypothetical protein